MCEPMRKCDALPAPVPALAIETYHFLDWSQSVSTDGFLAEHSQRSHEETIFHSGLHLIRGGLRFDIIFLAQ